MAIDSTRNGQRVRNVYTGATGVIEYHSNGYAGEQDHYLVTLDVTGTYGETQDWWAPSHIAAEGVLGEIAQEYDHEVLSNEMDENLFWLGIAVENRPEDIEVYANHFERLYTALEMDREAVAAHEGVLRAGVRTRLTPDRMVAIPGLGISVPVYV